MIATITKHFEKYTFAAGSSFMWSPSERTIYYEKDQLKQRSGLWSLLHELGHAELNHTKYQDDFHLLIMEVEAWSEAKKLAKNFDLEIDEGHIESCIDSYREWLHQRSKCIDCGSVSLQKDIETYQCHNCLARWKVPEFEICKIRT